MHKKVYAVIPVCGREILLYYTVKRLERQTYPTTAICCGSSESEKAVCEGAGAEFIWCPPETPLGEKWQKCVEFARDAGDAEAIMVLGSSDWIEDKWTETLMAQPHQAIGVAGLYFYDIRPCNATRLYFWPGYTGKRAGEAIGTGRIIKRELLDRMGWEIFYRDFNNSLDWSTVKLIEAAGERIICHNGDLKGLSISTYRWKNKHDFRGLIRTNKVDWFNEARTEKFISRHFPEGINLFRDYRE